MEKWPGWLVFLVGVATPIVALIITLALLGWPVWTMISVAIFGAY